MSPNQETLYVALANADVVAAVDLNSGVSPRAISDRSQGPGSVVQAIALSPDGRHLYASSGSLDAVAVFEVEVTDSQKLASDSSPGFIPTEWYPSALAVAGNDLLIATAKGQSSGPNQMMGKLEK